MSSALEPIALVEDDPSLGYAIIKSTEAVARRVRQLSLISIYHATSGHPGGSLSCADILATLYHLELNISPETVRDTDRDRFVMSKGHAVPALYAVGAIMGFVPIDDLTSLRKLGSPLQGHPHLGTTPWVEASTGSLGQGFSSAFGMALGLMAQQSTARVYALLGDGELQEGQVWETAMASAHYGLDNFTAIIDYNKLQSDATNDEIMGLEPLADKWRAFGWNVFDIDGHNIEEIVAALVAAREAKGAPSLILAHTIKGKGVRKMENSPAWHGSVKMNPQETRDALAELGLDEDEINLWIGNDDGTDSA